MPHLESIINNEHFRVRGNATSKHSSPVAQSAASHPSLAERGGSAATELLPSEDMHRISQVFDADSYFDLFPCTKLALNTLGQPEFQPPRLTRWFTRFIYPKCELRFSDF